MMPNQSERTKKLLTNQDRKRGLLYQSAGNAYTCNWLILGIGLLTPAWFKMTNGNLPDLKCTR